MAAAPALHSTPLPDVPPLRDGELQLVLIRRSMADSSRGWAPAYHFEIRVPEDEVAGWIDLRVGHSADLPLYNGHIGYTVREEYRGHHYAARACRLLFDVARRHGFTELWITCNPDNIASRRTCEIVGAELVEIIDLPPDNDLYRRGERRKCRYRLVLQA